MSAPHESDPAIQRAALLSRVELFSGLDRLMLARLAADLDPTELVDGQSVVLQGEPGDSLYLVARGQLGVFMHTPGDDEERQVATVDQGACFGEIALLTGEPRSATVRAIGSAETLRLDRSRFVELLRREPLMGLTISATLARRLLHANQQYLRAARDGDALPDGGAAESPPAPPAESAEPRPHALLAAGLVEPDPTRSVRATPRFLVAATVAAVSVAGAVWSSQAATPQVTFVFLLCAAIGLWVTAALPEFAVAIGLATGWILLGVAPPAAVLAGFGSPSWSTALAILGLGSAISTSGLLFRVGLLLLRRMPRGLVGQAATFLFTGVLLTPLLPSSTARGALTVPLALTAAGTQRLKERSPESALLGLSAYIGANPLLFAFLNGSTSCLLAIGLLPEATRQRFDFANWFLAALPLTLMTAVGVLAAMVLLLRPGRAVAVSGSRLALQLSLLGRPTGREWTMGVILVLTVVGWNVAPALGVGSTAVSLLALLAAIVTGCFNRASLQQLNWDFLISFGVVLSLSQLVVLLGLDRVAASQVSALLGGQVVHPVLFVLGVGLLTLIVRIFLPQDQALLLICIALVPSAPLFGVDPWIVAIASLATFSTWFYPSQTIGFPLAYDASEGRLYSHAQARLVCAGFTVAVLLALAASVPYWRLLGLL